jgi:type II secretory pathway pseudopilin PulG
MKKMSMLRKESGFTTIELLVILVLLISLMLFVFSGCAQQLRRALQEETIANLKTIQAALERYASDHNGAYPAYILGGDAAGWDLKAGCDTIVRRPPFVDNIKQTNLEGGGAQPPFDPLIDGGYLESYPDNPFLQNLTKKAPAFSGGVEGKIGSGDVRFGFNSTIMGNALDDPRFLWSRYPVFDQPDNVHVQPTRMVNTMSQSAWSRGFGSIYPKNEINPFYSTGGIPDPDDPRMFRHRWWPGEFFYRASGEVWIRSDFPKELIDTITHMTIWDFEVAKYDKYILGAYADTATTGLDLIRLTQLDGKTIQNRSGPLKDVYNRNQSAPYREDVRIYMSPPEVFGGGQRGVAPVFPYFDREGVFIYGAPDGFPDGILSPVFVDHSGSL